MSLAKWSSMSALNEKREKRRAGLPSGFVFQPNSPNSPTINPTREPLSTTMVNREPKRKSMYHRFNSRNFNNSNNTSELPFLITPDHHHYWPIKSLMHQDQLKCSILNDEPEAGYAVDIEGTVFIRPEFFVETIDFDHPELEIEQFYVYQVFVAHFIT